MKTERGFHCVSGKYMELSAARTGKYRFYVLGILTLVTTLSFVDRSLISILGPAIQADLKLEDWQMGIVTGLAFALLYVLATIPIARLADKTSKVSVIAGAVALWSGFTAICGFANSFIQLALARVGVSIGDAGGTAPAHALLSEYFAKEERARALAILNLGISFGVAFAYLGGGYVADKLGWRLTFIVIGLPGILVALIVKLTVKDPRKKIPAAVTRKEGVAIKGDNDFFIMWNAAKHMMGIATYRWAVFGMSCMAITTFAFGTWIVIFFMRIHPDFPFWNLMLVLGFTAIFFNTTSSLIGGFLVDKLAKTNLAWYGYVPAISLFLFFPANIWFFWSPTPLSAIAALVAINLIAGVYIAPSFALAQTLAPVSIRALAAAVFIFIFNLFGMGLGPTLVGFLSSALEPSYGNILSLKLAMSIVSAFAVLGGFFYLMVAKTIKPDWARAVAVNAEASAKKLSEGV